jgi:hypothetical protein
LHKDCPRDQLFCYNCNQTGHSSKNCKRPKPWEQQQPPAMSTASTPTAVPAELNVQSDSLLGSTMTPPPGLSGRGSVTRVPADPWNMNALNDSLNANPSSNGAYKPNTTAAVSSSTTSAGKS